MNKLIKSVPATRPTAPGSSSRICHGGLKHFLVLCVVGVASTATGQTNYIGVGAGSALDIATVSNWSPASLPTLVSNPGTISSNSTVNAGAGNFTYTNYFITLTGGTMTQFNSGNDPTFSGGIFTVNGGTYGTAAGTGRGFRIDGSNVATLTSGTINSGSTANGGMNINGGSSLTVNGGLLQQWGNNRNILLTGNSSLTVNGGIVTMDTSITATGSLGVNHLSSGNNTINLNGGNTTANFLAFGNNAASPRLRLTLGGTTAGIFTAVNFKPLDSQEVIGARRINWMPGSLMEMTISNADEWAATEWTADRMFFNDQSSSDLGGLSWADASNPSVGLPGGYYWNYDSGTETLSVVAVPEPASLAAVGIVGLLVLARVRRHRNEA